MPQVHPAGCTSQCTNLHRSVILMHLSERLSAPFCTMQSPSTITSCTLHCTNSPLAPPSFALVAPLTAPSGPYRGQGACWACCWRIAGSGMGAVGDGPITGPHSARAAPSTRDAAPVAGARVCAGCMIGAVLQGIGGRGQTCRSQSDCHMFTQPIDEADVRLSSSASIA